MSVAHTVDPPTDTSAVMAREAGAHLLFVPEWSAPRFFLWGSLAKELHLSALGDRAQQRLPDASGECSDLSGYAIAINEAVPALAALSTAALASMPSSIAVWSLASKLLLDLIVRERCIPHIVNVHGQTQARWAVSLSLADDQHRVNALAKSFPVAAHVVPIESKHKQGSLRIWSSDALLREFLNMGADALIRAAGRAQRKPAEKAPWPKRFTAALVQSTNAQDCARFEPQGFGERSVLDELHAWPQPVLGAATGAPRLCIRLVAPSEHAAPPHDKFELQYFLQAAEDPEVCVPAQRVFASDADIKALHCDARIAEEQLLKSLATAGRLFAPIESSLHQPRPTHVQLKIESAWQFLNEAADALVEAGIGVQLPQELLRNGKRRLRMRMRIESSLPTSGSNELAIHYRWEAELDGQLLTQKDLAELAELKAPLLLYRNHWVAVDRDDLTQAQKLLANGGGSMSRVAALAAALGGVTVSGADVGGIGSSRASDGAKSEMPVEVIVDQDLARLLAELNEASTQHGVTVPATLRGELRPYQQRGLSWLAMMARFQLGACLADDMGLGKTIQLLAYLLHRREQSPNDARPILLVCPTSVLGNWQREIARFAPAIPVCAFYGPERSHSPDELRTLPPGSIVMTSFGLLRRESALLQELEWAVVVLDEAQNIKNASSRTARAARALQADFRIALTGTPVENRLTELWSICEFLNPSMLGSFEGFRREIAIPIERFGRDDVAERLKHIVRPLILRRVKTDPAVIQDLPPKQEMTVYCTLTREQAVLYRSALDAAMERIEGADGIERRGHVLALITALKQICNHPAQYLGEAGPLGGRSGKLERLREMLEETLAAGDRVLVFTQYREMGQRLVQDLTRHFGETVQFLHGGTPRAARDVMIKRFQEGGTGPKIFVLSLRAGGTGLNLTAATHVFHYDRWWNPAVEDQATDRAYRIGQDRRVQVHKFLCAGTIEERVNQMLESKRDLAARIVGQGEQWISELDNQQLRELFSLSPNAVIGGEESDDTVDDVDTRSMAPASPNTALRAAKEKSKSKSKRSENADWVNEL